MDFGLPTPPKLLFPAPSLTGAETDAVVLFLMPQSLARPSLPPVASITGKVRALTNYLSGDRVVKLEPCIARMVCAVPGRILPLVIYMPAYFVQYEREIDARGLRDNAPASLLGLKLAVSYGTAYPYRPPLTSPNAGCPGMIIKPVAFQ